MSVFRKSTKKASARQQIDIKGVKDGILELTNRRYRLVLQVSPINFELKSEDEQDALIDTYESFLNSVGCPLQILMRTREIDMDKYLDDLAEQTQKEEIPIYKQQLENYDEFFVHFIGSANNRQLFHRPQFNKHLAYLASFSSWQEAKPSYTAVRNKPRKQLD